MAKLFESGGTDHGPHGAGGLWKLETQDTVPSLRLPEEMQLPIPVYRTAR